MSRIIAFYAAALAWLAGFGTAAVASPTPGAVICGTLGLLAFLGAVSARYVAHQPPTRHRTGSVGGSG